MSGRGLWQRSVVVEAGPPGQPGRRYEGLRTSFTIEHRPGGYPSTGRMEIYNAGEQALTYFLPRANEVLLKIGYDGDEKLVFKGNPKRDGVELRGVGDGDRVITVEASDGGRGYTNTNIVRSYAEPVAYGALLDEILSGTGWGRGEIDLPESFMAPPVVIYHPPDQILDRIGEILLGTDQGYDWFVRDHRLYVIRRGRATSDPSILISQREGNLIGTPTATRKGCRLRALIDPGMRPYRTFEVQSDLVNGVFIAMDVTLSGDNWSNDFYMDITARRRGLV